MSGYLSKFFFNFLSTWTGNGLTFRDDEDEKAVRTVNDPLSKIVRGPQTLCGRHAMFLLCELIKPPQSIRDIGLSGHFLRETFYIKSSLVRQSINND